MKKDFVGIKQEVELFISKMDMDTFCLLDTCFKITKGFWGFAKGLKTVGYDRFYDLKISQRFILKLSHTDKLFKIYKIVLSRLNRLSDKYSIFLCTAQYATALQHTIHDFLSQFKPGEGILPENVFSKRMFELKDAQRYLNDIEYYTDLMNKVMVSIQNELTMRMYEHSLINQIDDAEVKKKEMKKFRKSMKCKPIF